MQSYTFTKKTVECYQFRNLKEGWADITIDAHEKSGRISIASDFGDYQYYWGACGTSFKELLASLDIHYAAGKFGADKFFDLESTVNSFREQAAQSFRKDDPEKEKVLHEILFLQQCSGNEREFVNQLISDCPNTMDMFGGSPQIDRTINPHFKRFWQEIWPLLLGEFKNELQNTAK
jgi:hypothetical protein